MITLHDYAASANCFKVRLLLAQLGMPYERVPVDIFAGESGTEGFLARNPAGRTPVLELESGDHIAESNAILLHLAEGTPFLVGDRYTVADIALYGYAHVAHEAGIEMEPYAAVRVWLSRVASQPGAIHDLEPYPPNASV